MHKSKACELARRLTEVLSIAFELVEELEGRSENVIYLAPEEDELDAVAEEFSDMGGS